MPIISPAVKGGAVITVLLLVVSVVLDVFDFVGWSWVDIATVGLIGTTLTFLLFGAVSISSKPGFAGSKETASEIHARSVSQDGLTGLAGQREFDWQIIAAAIVPGLVGFLMFVIF